jgi:hypothetical protein
VQIYNNKKTEISHLLKHSDPLLGTLLKHLWQRLLPRVFLCMDTTSLAHLYLGSFSHSSLQILSSSVRLDGEHCSTAFQVSPEMFDWVQVQFLAGSLEDIQRLVPTPLLRCLCYVLRDIVLLENEPSPQSEVLSTLEQVFIKDLYTLLCSSLP